MFGLKLKKCDAPQRHAIYVSQVPSEASLFTKKWFFLQFFYGADKQTKMSALKKVCGIFNV